MAQDGTEWHGMAWDGPEWPGMFSFKHNKNLPGLPWIIWDSPAHRESGIVRDHLGLYEIIQYRPGWSGIIRDGQSNFIKLFDAGLQCEFIRTFLNGFKQIECFRILA